MVDSPGCAVRPIKPDSIPYLPTEKLVARYPQGFGLGIQQGVFDGAETFCHPVHRIARKALSGSTVKLEEAILEWSSLKGVDRNYVVDLLPNKVRARYLDIADRMSRSAGGEGELLLMIADYAAKEQRKLSAEIKSLKGVMNAMSDCCETSDGFVDLQSWTKLQKEVLLKPGKDPVMRDDLVPVKDEKTGEEKMLQAPPGAKASQNDSRGFKTSWEDGPPLDFSGQAENDMKE